MFRIRSPVKLLSWKNGVTQRGRYACKTEFGMGNYEDGAKTAA